MAWIYPPSNGAENTFLVQYPMLIEILIQKVILKAYTDSEPVPKSSFDKEVDFFDF